MDVVAVLQAVVHSAWLLPVLALMIAADGPLPMLPSETLLMTAAAVAFTEGDVALLVGLFLAAVLGSVAGDLLVYGLGRTSNKLIAGSSEGSCSAWVRRHLLKRPGAVLVGARFVPGGRLVSTAAAGRFGLPLRRFVPWSLASSAAWAAYMLVVGRVLEPITGGNPLLCVAGAGVLAVLTAGVFALARRVTRGRVLPADVDRPVSAEAPRSADTGHEPQRLPVRGDSALSRSPSSGASRSVTGRVAVARSTVSVERRTAADRRPVRAPLPHVGE
ncbi:hypothetical protein GCM10017691_46400 [Pseudonocardia petroleophila]|uniref:VTT domain-containing protein n=1 Tax=Pseudonocardia petroleophila TaxID=37331 RepID=A0A7G7MQT9_9PSEU|nr:VTT domain-containing protein [Pseudonocardia petroleophila]QNG55150.1 VTT domain-containing protein [Pseudonocardia petroleophila]